MKKTTIFGKIQILLVILAFTGGFVKAGNIDITDNTTTELKLRESTYSLIDLRNTISDIQFTRVKTQQGYFTLFTINDYNCTMYEGNPKLPVMKKLIEVPVNATYEYEILYEDYVTIDLADYGITDPVIPVQPPLSKNIDNPEDIEFAYNQAVYQTDDFLGQPEVNVIDLGVLRGVRLARLEISPVFYNPVQNKLKVYKDIEVKVHFKGGDVTSTIEEKQQKFSPYYNDIFDQLINYKPLGGKEFITEEPVTYIIVSDPMFEDALQPFIEWKTKKGYQVVEAYTDDPQVGTTTSSIKSYLQDFYNNPPEGYNPQSFVLLVGDVNQIPAFSGSSSYHITDLYYFTYDGPGDIYPECFYGRFSAENLTQLQPQIDKTLEYEQYLFPDPSFLDEVVMIAGADGTYAQTWGNGQITYGTTNYFNAAHGLYSHTYLQPEPSGGNYSENIRQNISDGVTYGNYTAHCSALGWANPSFNIGHISQLTNAHKYPLLVGNCCSSVEFQGTCFGEEIMRAQDKGAVGYIGGSNSTYWDEDFWWGVGAEDISPNPVYNENNLGAYDRTFHDHGETLSKWFVTQGQMPSAGDLAVTQAGSSLETYYWEIYHLMGDPSVMIYFSQPPETAANYSGLMPLNTTSFEVNTEPYGYVAISSNGVLNGCGLADENGLAEVNMFNPISVPGDADVVITGQNMKPYIGTVNVASPNGPYMLLDELSLNDNGGNGNNQADFGESIDLDVTLQNLGSQIAQNINATISTSDEYVTIDVSSHDWPDIAAGSSMLQSGAFSIAIDEMIPDQHIVQFDLEITSGDETWTDNFEIVLNAPVLSNGSYIIDDASGNNNNRLDPGETVTIIVPNLNEGGSDALNTMASMVSSNSMITINNATYTVGTIASGDSGEAIFSVTVDPDATLGEIVTADYTLESDPYVSYSVLSFNIGLMIEDFETGSFNSFNWEFSGNADWEIVETGIYQGEYSVKSGDISDNETSRMAVTLNVINDDQISFFCKVSSEDGYDFLKFYIDGVMEDSWDGQMSWTEVAYDVTAGVHTFEWSYEKDYSMSSYDDCGYVDYIVLPPFSGATPLGVMVTASPEEVCQGESSQLNAITVGGSGNYTYDWSPSSGLNDPGIANPVATPLSTTTYTVTVNDGENTTTDEIELVVQETPAQPTITQNNNTLVSSAATGNQWYDSEGIIPGAVQQTYLPTKTDDYYVVVTNGLGCESEPSESIHFIYTGVIELKAGQKVKVYPNPFAGQLTIDYSIGSSSQVTVSLYNSFGQKISMINPGKQQGAGNHRITINTDNLSYGLYFLRIETKEYSQLKRIIHSQN